MIDDCQWFVRIDLGKRRATASACLMSTDGKVSEHDFARMARAGLFELRRLAALSVPRPHRARNRGGDRDPARTGGGDAASITLFGLRTNPNRSTVSATRFPHGPAGSTGMTAA